MSEKGREPNVFARLSSGEEVAVVPSSVRGREVPDPYSYSYSIGVDWEPSKEQAAFMESLRTNPARRVLLVDAACRAGRTYARLMEQRMLGGDPQVVLLDLPRSLSTEVAARALDALSMSSELAAISMRKLGESLRDIGKLPRLRKSRGARRHARRVKAAARR